PRQRAMNQRHRSFVAARVTLALAAPVLIAGCAQATGSGAQPGDLPDGRTFVSTSVTEGSHDRTLVRGTKIVVTFEQGLVAATAGWNRMSGQGDLDGGRLIVESLATTAMGCDSAENAQDQWLGTFLTSGPELTLTDATLTLRGATVNITLTATATVSPA